MQYACLPVGSPRLRSYGSIQRFKVRGLTPPLPSFGGGDLLCASIRSSTAFRHVLFAEIHFFVEGFLRLPVYRGSRGRRSCLQKSPRIASRPLHPGRQQALVLSCGCPGDRPCVPTTYRAVSILAALGGSLYPIPPSPQWVVRLWAAHEVRVSKCNVDRDIDISTVLRGLPVCVVRFTSPFWPSGGLGFHVTEWLVCDWHMSGITLIAQLDISLWF